MACELHQTISKRAHPKQEARFARHFEPQILRNELDNVGPGNAGRTKSMHGRINYGARRAPAIEMHFSSASERKQARSLNEFFGLKSALLKSAVSRPLGSCGPKTRRGSASARSSASTYIRICVHGQMYLFRFVSRCTVRVTLHAAACYRRAVGRIALCMSIHTINERPFGTMGLASHPSGTMDLRTQNMRRARTGPRPSGTHKIHAWTD